MLELETAVAGIGSVLVFNDGRGFQEGVDSMGMRVWDKGVDKRAPLGMRIKLPELIKLPKLEGAED